MLQWKFNFPWIWCSVLQAKFTILQDRIFMIILIFSAQFHWFWVVWTKYWNWGNVSANFKELICFYILEHTCYITCKTYVYRHMRKKNKPVHSENLTSGQIIFKEWLIWLVWRNSFCKELFRSDIAYTLFSVQKNIKF